MSAADQLTPRRSGPVAAGESGARTGAVGGGLIAAVRGYQLARSGRPSGCRYLPSCSEYAAEAIRRHGTVRGSWLAVRRLARCHPWGGHGIDPVPDRRDPCSDH